MDAEKVKSILEKVKNGECGIDEAAGLINSRPYEDLGYAKVDMDRKARQGVNEVIYGAGKTAEQIAGIASAMAGKSCENILVTRIDKEKADAVISVLDVKCEYHRDARILVVNPADVKKTGKIVIASGGTSDMPVCEEAAITAELLGNNVVRLYDSGVAGIHRLLSQKDVIESARVIIAVAGMEGALASVIGGLCSCPVIAVPTSVGYGANFGGLSALLSMLNSCASGVSVVNIDNGFGAAFIASRINKMCTAED